MKWENCDEHGGVELRKERVRRMGRKGLLEKGGGSESGEAP